MPVTTLHKLIGLSVALLGQAPGTDLLNQWTRLYTQSREDGMDAMAALQKVAQHILDSDAFAEVHPAYTIIENQEFAQRFLNQMLGETASAEVVTLVVGLLNSGTSRAEVAVRAVEYLLEVNHQGNDHPDHGTFGTYAMRFGNQVEVARYYTVDKKWMTPGESVLNEVDDTAASVTAAKGSIDGMQQPGKNFALTTGVDQFTGTPGNDTFVATESTLNGADRLDGKEGMDTLELSSGSGANADISIPRGATVEDIETLSVTSDGKFTGDVSAWTGLETVKLEVVKDVDLELDADAAVKVMSDSLGDDEDASEVTIENAGMVALEGVSKQATVKITGEGTESVMVAGGKSVHVNTKASPSMTVNSVTVNGVARNNGEDGKRDGTTGAGTAAKDKDKASVEVYSKALENIALHNTDAIVLLQNDDKDLTGLKAMVNKFGSSASMMGKLCLKGIEDLMLQVAGASYFDLASNEIKSINVSGTGDLTLDVNKFDNSKASTTLESLMLSGSGKFTMKDASGLSKLKTIDAEEASGDVHIEKLGDSLTSYKGSSGKDTISVTAFAQAGLMANLGAGDDTFTVDNLAAGKSKVDGGAGMDTLVLKQTDGAKVKGAGDSYSNFETITLEAGGGKGTYDVKGLDIDKIIVSSSVGAATGVKFMNVMKGTDLSIVSNAPKADSKSTLAIVNYMLETGEASRFSNSGSTLNLNLHANGHKDDTAKIAGALEVDVYTDAAGTQPNQAYKDYSPKRGTFVNLTVDKQVEVLHLDASATPANDAVKAEDYQHFLAFRGADNIEAIKITGNAKIYLSNLNPFERNAAGDAVSKNWGLNKVDIDSNALTKLEYVDATENTAGIELYVGSNTVSLEVDGSSADDIILGGGSTGKNDTFNGHGGSDLIAGGKGQDMITGGLGADVLTGGGGQLIASINPMWGYPDNQYRDSTKDTFIYNAASDSQLSSFDIIANFEGAHDVIDLRKVVDLQGTIKNGNHGMDGASGGGDDFTANTAGNTLAKFIDKGTGVFETSNSNELGSNKHSIVLVDTQEDGFKDVRASTFGGKRDDFNVKWILVDVDGDGDFNAGVDMVIALTTPDGTVDTGNFM